MKKVFFSQRFHDKSEEDIFEERDILKTYFKDHLGVEVELLDQYHIEAPLFAPPTYNWAQDLLMLGESDLVVFCHDWEKALGCQMEMLTCKKYDIPYMILPKITLWGKVMRDLENLRGGC